MPYKSDAQAAFMHIHHPDIAKKWDKNYGESGPLPEHVKKKKDSPWMHMGKKKEG